MFEQCTEDANPNENQCMLVDQFITCATLKELSPEVTQATLDALQPHVMGCSFCKINFMLSGIFTLCLEREDVHVIVKEHPEHAFGNEPGSGA
jgi:hypothetical protein